MTKKQDYQPNLEEVLQAVERGEVYQEGRTITRLPAMREPGLTLKSLEVKSFRLSLWTDIEQKGKAPFYTPKPSRSSGSTILDPRQLLGSYNDPREIRKNPERFIKALEEDRTLGTRVENRRYPTTITRIIDKLLPPNYQVSDIEIQATFNEGETYTTTLDLWKKDQRTKKGPWHIRTRGYEMLLNTENLQHWTEIAGNEAQKRKKAEKEKEETTA